LILVAVDVSKGGRPFVFRHMKMKALRQNPQTIDKHGEDIPEMATTRQYKKKGTLLAACEAYTYQTYCMRTTLYTMKFCFLIMMDLVIL